MRVSRIQLCRVLSLCVWALGVSTVAAQWTRLPTVTVQGREYVRVADLARVYGLKSSTSGKTVSLASAQVTLRIERDSREAVLNGTTVWLSAAPLVVRGQLVMARLDVQKVIDPILFAPRAKTGETIRTIVIDPGHGGNDQGARSRSGIREKTVVLDVSKRLEALLKKHGFRASLVRTSDATVSLDQRVSIARERGADLFVSVHFNAVANARGARGIETYCLTPSGAASTASSKPLTSWLPGNNNDSFNMLLAYSIQRNVLRVTGAPDRGVRRARFYVLQHVKCPAVLVECGFLSNTAEAEKVATASYRESLASGICNGILTYQRTVERP